ncbi:hypothetical protein [Micropruina glycogenica]|uniref:hypothetical protein n=1 Tax=Micropruina glycogenica TaxID=75385 RepID=UPI000CF6FC20|nr:hypothetical protein [Micropruina glycogenica]
MVQTALIAAATATCFRATSHQQAWLMTFIASVFVGWALLRPDSPATLGWVLTIGAWWFTGLAYPTIATTLQTALLTLAAHYVTAARASNHRSTRLSPRYLANCLAVLGVLMLATALAAPVISAISDSPVTSDQWTIVWMAAAIAALSGLAWRFTTKADPDRQ